LPDVHLVAGGEVPADRVAGIDHGVRPDPRAAADGHRDSRMIPGRHPDETEILDSTRIPERHGIVNSAPPPPLHRPALPPYPTAPPDPFSTSAKAASSTAAPFLACAS